MTSPFKYLLLAGHGAATRPGDLGLAILRTGIGLYLGLGHGMSKVFQSGHFGPTEQFVKAIGGMGFPAPTFFAWMSALTEFLGGLLLAIGLFTRPVALFLVINMLVAAFVASAHAPWVAPPGQPSKEAAIVYLLPFILFVFTGGGRFSADAMIHPSLAKKDPGY